MRPAVLTKKDNEWYGTCGKDVWFVLVDETEGFVSDYRFARCKCGNTTFEVGLTYADREYVSRICTKCTREHWMLDEDEVAAEEIERCRCDCGGEAFEVMAAIHPWYEPGQVEPTPNEWAFYLGLRCVGCGWIGCHSEGFFEDDDPAAWLDHV
jgi:hypothetical protein